MSLLQMLMNAQGGQGMGRLAQQFGMDEAKAGGLAAMLAPAIARGTRERARQGGLGTVLGELQGEAQATYVDDPASAAAPEGQAQGQRFLDQILGSREASDELAAEAANRTGADFGAVAQFLPAIAAILQGGMQRSVPDSAIQGMMSQTGHGSGAGGGIMGVIGDMMGGGKSGGPGGGLDMLTSMLDADGDGSALDDILERVMRR